jgi:ribonuclease-3
MNTQDSPGNLTPQEISQRLGITFRDIRLLTRALTHRSYVNEHSEAIEDNERLEFLGDAVLDFLVGAWLYNHFPELKEGGLTRLRSALVGNNQLAEFARQIDLGSLMLIGQGEMDGGGRERPALLGCTFEAVIGALYLDQGIQVVRNFVEPMLEGAEDILSSGGEERDPKSQLQEWAQANGYGTPSYRTVAASGPEHGKRFDVAVVLLNADFAFGSGPSKSIAAKEAAYHALEILKSKG